MQSLQQERSQRSNDNDKAARHGERVRSTVFLNRSSASACSRRISRRASARRAVGNRSRGKGLRIRNKQCLNNSQCAERLAETAAHTALTVPAELAIHLLVLVAAVLGRALGRGLEHRRKHLGEERRRDDGACEGARSEALEGTLVRVAFVVYFAGDLGEDVVFDEDARRGVGETVDGLLPLVVFALGYVPHVGRGLDVEGDVVGPLDFVDLGAVARLICSIVDVVVGGHQADFLGPVEGFLGPFGVGGVAGELCETGSKEEEVAGGDGILVGVPVVELEDLPVQPSIAGLVVPALRLSVKNVGCQSRPRCVCYRRRCKLSFGSRHGCQPPCTLVIITEYLGLIVGHEGVIFAQLMLEALGEEIIVLIVTGQIRVVNETAEHGTRFPPIIRIREEPRNEVILQIASVQVDDATGKYFRSALD